MEELDPAQANPRTVCGQKGGPTKGGQGPFGLLVLASKDIQEYTAVYFKVFRNQTKYVVLMCSDQSRHNSQNNTLVLKFPLLQPNTPLLYRSSLHLDYDKPVYGAFVDLDPVKEKLSLRTLVTSCSFVILRYREVIV